MIQNDKVNNLFKNTLTESEINRFSVCGFDKYIVCNDVGTLFVVWINKTDKKYFFSRTKLMMEKYARAKLPFNILPDCEFLCNMTVREYRIQQRLASELKPIFDVLDSFYDCFCEKTK